jgi:demethylspheroidene O-methyltransferase
MSPELDKTIMTHSWRERWVQGRNRWLSDPAFQRFSWKVPIFRSIALRRSKAIFDLVAGFTYSQLLHAGVRLGVFDLLKERPHSPGEIAAAADLPESSAKQLLKGLAALGLAESLGDGRFALGQHGAAMVANPGIIAMIEHHDLLYADLADPVAMLRHRGGGRLSGYWPYAEDQAGDVAPYSRLMAASQPMVAQTILDTVDLRDVRVLLDVGGGEGAFLEAAGARHPHLALMLFDIPDVAERAAARLGSRVRACGGRFPDDPLPTGADAVSLVRILHDHDDEKVMALLRRVAECLPSGGRVIIAEPMAGTDGAEAMGDAYFGLYLMAMGSGRPRTPREIMAMLRAAGFDQVQELRTDNPYSAQIVSGRLVG